MIVRSLFAALLVAALVDLINCQGVVNFRAKEKKILDEIMHKDRYDTRIRPAGQNLSSGMDGPAHVQVNILIRSISKIDDVMMEMSVQITLRGEWEDDRLQYDSMGGRIKSITLTEPDKIWKPDLFFSNEKDGRFHKIIMDNVLLRIYPNGYVLYSIRISLRLSCPMDLHLFPMDHQTCLLQMASYGYTTEDLVFKWKHDDSPKSVQVREPLHLPRFALQQRRPKNCTSKTTTGEYSCLQVDLLFKREFSYYLIQIYIPCCMLVIVSWVSFWLDQNAVPARVSLGVTTLLTMATQTSSINASLPPVSYTKAIDVWTGVCLTFVFGALLEFALVNYATRSDQHRQRIKEQIRKWDIEHAQMEHDQENESHTIQMKPLMQLDGRRGGAKNHCEVHSQPPQPKPRNCCRTWLSKFPKRSKRIDVISRIIFPLMFAFFNLAYWSTYLIHE